MGKLHSYWLIMALGCIPWMGYAVGLEDILSVELQTKGRSSGIIADLVVHNTTSEEINVFFGPHIAFVDEDYSPVYMEGFPIRISAGRKKTYEVSGYSLLNHMPVLPQGKTYKEGIALYQQAQALFVRGLDTIGSSATGLPSANDDNSIAYAGTGIPCRITLDPMVQRQAFSNMMLDVELWIEKAYRLEAEAGHINTALSGDPATQKSFLIQLVTWVYAGALSNRPYDQHLFREDLLVKFRKNSGALAKPDEAAYQRQIERESARFYDAAVQIGKRAGIFVASESMGQTVVSVANASASWCKIPGRQYPVYVEDRYACVFLQGEPASQNRLHALLSDKSGFSFSSLSHRIEDGEILTISGRLDPFSFDGKFLWKTKNSPERIYEANIDATSNTFDFKVPFRNRSRITVDLVAQDDQNEYTLFSSRFRINEETVSVQKGDLIPVEGSDMRVALISRDAVYLQDESYSHRLIRDIIIPVKETMIVLDEINVHAETAKIRILSKKCCQPASPGRGSADEDLYSELLQRPPDVSSRGYRGMVLDPAIAFSPAEDVVGVIANFSTNPGSVCCGWLSAGDLDHLWGPYMADMVHKAMKSAIDSAGLETGPFRVVLMDPATRRLIGGSFQERSYPDRYEIMPSAKLLNPDLIIDGRISFRCCTEQAETACAESALQMVFDVSLINAENGIILSSFSSEGLLNGKPKKTECYNPLASSAPNFREKIGSELSNQAAKQFLERLTWKVQW